MADRKYIERGALIKDIEENQRNTEHHKDGRGKQIHVGEHRHFIRMVYEQPAADVVEVVHGEWISVESDVIFKCSICDAEVSTSWDYENDDMFKYCPCCGAKMDGERKDKP